MRHEAARGQAAHEGSGGDAAARRRPPPGSSHRICLYMRALTTRRKTPLYTSPPPPPRYTLCAVAVHRHAIASTSGRHQTLVRDHAKPARDAPVEAPPPPPACPTSDGLAVLSDPFPSPDHRHREVLGLPRGVGPVHFVHPPVLRRAVGDGTEGGKGRGSRWCGWAIPLCPEDARRGRVWRGSGCSQRHGGGALEAKGVSEGC